MSDTGKLADKTCQPCTGDTPAIGADTAARMLQELEGWTLRSDGKAISRRWETKGFLKAQALANLAGTIGDGQGHHPDIRHGWGYCEVDFTTHAVGGLTDSDFICAAKIDTALR